MPVSGALGGRRSFGGLRAHPGPKRVEDRDEQRRRHRDFAHPRAARPPRRELGLDSCRRGTCCFLSSVVLFLCSCSAFFCCFFFLCCERMPLFFSSFFSFFFSWFPVFDLFFFVVFVFFFVLIEAFARCLFRRRGRCSSSSELRRSGAGREGAPCVAGGSPSGVRFRRLRGRYAGVLWRPSWPGRRRV